MLWCFADNLGSHNDWIWKRKSRECKSLNYLITGKQKHQFVTN